MSDQPNDYKVELDAFAGPLDLLLYLIRRDEVDIYDIPIARITRQYMEYLDLIADLNINVAGEFVVMAATLMEIKSRMMAPEPEPGEDEEAAEDPRLDLVRQLMDYKRFKEAALDLKAREAERAERFSRAGERPEGTPRSSAPLPADLTLFALLDAFTRILEQTGRRGPHHVVMEDTPQETLRERLEARAKEAGRIAFADLFEGEWNRAVLVGMFLALLELVKQQVLRVEQEQVFGEILLAYVPEEERVVYEDPPPAEEPPPEEADPPDQSPLPVEEAWDEESLDMDLPDIPDVPDDDPPAPDSSPPKIADLADGAGEAPAQRE